MAYGWEVKRTRQKHCSNTGWLRYYVYSKKKKIWPSFASKISSALVNSLITNRLCSTKLVVVDGTSWSDDESGCSIAANKYMPADFARFSFETSTLGRSHQKRINFSTASHGKKTKINGSDYDVKEKGNQRLFEEWHQMFSPAFLHYREKETLTGNEIVTELLDTVLNPCLFYLNMRKSTN